MKLIRTLIAAVLAAATLALPTSQAQVYPSNTPVYIPSAVLAASTLTTANTVVFNANGLGTILLRVAGTNSVMSATVQITESRSSPSWTTVPVDTVGGSRVGTIVANGLYRVNIAGAAQVRFNLASFTGTNVIFSASATPAPQFTASLPVRRSTFSVATTAQTVASSGTDMMGVIGSATATLRILRASCNGVSDNVSSFVLFAVKRSGSNTGGTTYSASPIAHDSNNTTAAGTAVVYAANPTLGALVGTVRSGRVLLGPSGTVTATPTVFTFGQGDGEQDIVLRGVNEQFSLSAGGVTLATGHSLNCNITWTQE